MNIFYLSNDVKKCAQFHNNKHVVKMCTEYAQILSTAHRVLDGSEFFELSKSGRNIKRFKLNDSKDLVLYKATHINHPSSKWVRESIENYKWLYSLFKELLIEYHIRYCKHHACEKLLVSLKNTPKNIKNSKFTEPPQCMPEYCRKPNAIDGYRNYYLKEKSSFLDYKNRDIPMWIK